MKEDMLLQIFNEGTSGNNYAKGQRVLNNDLVSTLEITNEENIIYIDGNVISENLFNEYHTSIGLDSRNMDILSTSCSCLDFEKSSINKENYCCKHIVATFYKAAQPLGKHPLIRDKGNEAKDNLSNKTNILELLLNEEKDKEELKIEVYLNLDSFNGALSAEFKIGPKNTSSNNLFILKDINQFLLAYHNSFPVEFSKNFTFHIKYHSMCIRDKRLISFIDTLNEIEGRNKFIGRKEDKLIDGKYINIPDYLVREFFETVKRHKIFLNDGFYLRPVETEVLHGKPLVDFDLKLVKDNYILKSLSGMPTCLGAKNDVFLYGTSIYLPDHEFCYKLYPFVSIFNQMKVVTFPTSSGDTVLRKLIPELYNLSPNISLDKKITDKIVSEEALFRFYLDKKDDRVVLIPKVKYGPYEFLMFEDIEEKVIYRDKRKEAEVISVINSLGFEEENGSYYFSKAEDYLFIFFRSEIGRLHQYGEVYYSESFKGIKHMGSKGIRAMIKSGKFNYFEMNFEIGDISPEETIGILKAFRGKLKYYKLKSGEFLDLEDMELRNFLKLIDMVAEKGLNNNHLEISKNRAAYLGDYIEANELRYINGTEELREVSDKLKNLDKHNIEASINLNGVLREYQRVGFNWLRNIDYLGFGGILGDEMGLGKTLQAISFILSNSESKTLIVAPTSLVYNWIGEFEKFAPQLSAVAINGSKEDRRVAIKNIDKYDVLITTYNLLKRDIEDYKLIDFDYCIIDEAQYIKNPSSQNATAVKEIKARTRFALTGTPIENSLMELWSIFDFVMPGYLFDEKRFSVRYHKKLNEAPEVIEDLNKLIRPFILRRKKRDVIEELPDKIQKMLVVPLSEDQKKVYGAYNKHVIELIKKKVREDEFKNSRIEVLAYITRLRQLCLDPSIVMEEYRGKSGKIEAVVELLHQSLEENHRILVFSQFTSVLKNIGNRISEEGISFSYLDGSIPSQQRMKLVNSFNQGENNVFLISLKAGGTGLNLTSADIVIHFDPWWNPAVEEQATDRAHRIGQKNVVEVIKIIAKGTIEEKVLLLQEEKKKLISEVMGDELSEASDFSAFSEEELLGLFQMI